MKKNVYNLNVCHAFSGQKIGGEELIGGWIFTNGTEVSQDFWSPSLLAFLIFFLFQGWS
jgi:hypothetical protein